MANIEVGEFPGRRLDLAIHLTDVAVHPPLQGVNEMVNLPIAAFHHHLDAAIGQVLDVAVDIELQSDILCGVAEADPLNPAGEIAFTAMNVGPAMSVWRIHGCAI
jgi:hypothetical protein